MEKLKTTAPYAKSYLEKKYEFNLVKRFAKRKNTMKDTKNACVMR